MKYFKFFLLINLLLIASCEQQDKTQSWAEDEILIQLTELRKEVQSLRKEFKSLKQDIAKLDARKPQSKKVISMPLEKDDFLGKESAQLAIIEFSDFQCGFCARHAQQVYPELKKNFIETGKVKYFARNFPLSFHAQARSAAIVAECAAKQGKQWQAHELLFANSTQLADKFFNSMADKLALDKTQFESCRKDKTIAEKVDADITLGRHAGVSGVPRFYVGKIQDDKLVDVVLISGAQPYAAFERVINALQKDA